MSWRPLPSRLRGRVHTPPVLGSLVAVVATPVFGVLWLAGPLALAVLFSTREQYALAAAAAPIALWWTYRMLREPMLVGLLVSVPYGVVSLAQQWRGRVDTEDLEDGRYVSLADWRPLSAREREVLELLASARPDVPEIRRQLERPEVRAECVCGCPSILLYGTRPAIPRDAAHGNADGQRDELTIAADGPDGVEVVLRLQLCSARELEATTGRGHDGTPHELPPAGALRLRHDDGGADEPPGP